MPATRHRFSCGHLGRGAQCHRCAQAKFLAEELNKPLPQRFFDKPESRLQLAKEVARLLTVK